MSRHSSTSTRFARLALTVVFLATLIGGGFALVRSDRGQTIVGFFTSAIGLYPGDDVKVAGVRVGRVESITPQKGQVKVIMQVRSSAKIPQDVRAVVVSPNLVAARFIQLAPTYTSGPTLAPGADIGVDRTAVPVEWDEVKTELTKLSTELGPVEGRVQGPLTAAVNQAADTFSGNGDSFRQALRALAQTAGRLSDSRTDIFGTVRNLGALIDALSQTNEQVVQFAGRLASVSQVLADNTNDLDVALRALNQALDDVRTLLKDNNSALIGSVNKLTELSKLINDHSDDVEQILHVSPNGLSNFYNGYNPAQGTLSGQLQFPNFANPVQFICGSLEATGTADNFKRTEICRQRMGPVLKRIAMNYPPILFHPINTINAYKGQVIYDTPATEAKARSPIADLLWVPAPGVTPPAIPPDADLSAMLVPPPAAAPVPSTGAESVPPGPPLPAEAGGPPAAGPPSGGGP